MSPVGDLPAWIADFEYVSLPGERPRPVCLAAREVKSGKTVSVWLDGKEASKTPPFPTGEDALFVAFYAPAEMGCFLSLGWQMPVNTLDLFVEHRNRTNGIPGVGSSLLAACEFHGIADVPSSIHKEQMRDLVLTGGPFTREDRRNILKYCREDVRLTLELFTKMRSSVDWPRGLFRGLYQQAVALMEHRGIPIDVQTLTRLREHWQELQARLVGEIDADYGVFDGLVFKTDKFEQYLSEMGIPWPRTGTGRLSLSDDTFKDMTKVCPELQGLKDLRYLLGTMRLNALAVGKDGRNRCMLSPFRSKTGRNQPSSSKFVFGPSVWLRSLIKPGPGTALIYADFEQEEFAVAGYLSGDLEMQKAYLSGDAYLSFAKIAGAVPAEATKTSHKTIRDLYKISSLATQYGMGEITLSQQMGRPPVYARELLRQHRRIFRTYWDWSDQVQDSALLTRKMTTPLGWEFHIVEGEKSSVRSIRNWPVQSCGADILRMSCVLLAREGIEILAPVHDAILISSPLDEAEDTAKRAAVVMEKASSFVLGNQQTVRVEYKIIRYPDRYSDPRGAKTWDRVTRLLGEIDGEASP